MTSKKQFMQVMAVIFGLAALILFIVSINRIDFGFATLEYVNVPVMMMAIGSAVICVANIIGSLVAANQEELMAYIRTYSQKTEQAVYQNGKAIKAMQTPDKMLKTEARAENKTRDPEAARHIASFSELISGMTSNVEIRNLWQQQDFHSSAEHSDINQEILKAADIERMYGKSNTSVAGLKMKIARAAGEIAQQGAI